MTIAALDAGKHVLCEKAFAVNAGQAAAMVEAAGRNGCFLMEAMWTWFLPPVIEVRELVLDGAIGELTAFQASFSVPIWDRAERLRLPELAGGAVLDLGVYPVAVARYLLGAPSEVRAVGTLGETGVDRNLAGVLHHPGGQVAAFVAGLDAASSCTAEIVGTGGTITLDAPFHCPSGYTVARAGAAPEHVDRPHRGLAHEAEHAMARIAAGHLESDVIPLATSVAVMETLDEIRAQIGLVLPGDPPA
jgi:predicted dehydrogenase